MGKDQLLSRKVPTRELSTSKMVAKSITEQPGKDQTLLVQPRVKEGADTTHNMNQKHAPKKPDTISIKQEPARKADGFIKRMVSGIKNAFDKLKGKIKTTFQKKEATTLPAIKSTLPAKLVKQTLQLKKIITQHQEIQKKTLQLKKNITQHQEIVGVLRDANKKPRVANNKIHPPKPTRKLDPKTR